jgi:hypothetical protein
MLYLPGKLGSLGFTVVFGANRCALCSKHHSNAYRSASSPNYMGCLGFGVVAGEVAQQLPLRPRQFLKTHYMHKIRKFGESGF